MLCDLGMPSGQVAWLAFCVTGGPTPPGPVTEGKEQVVKPFSLPVSPEAPGNGCCREAICVFRQCWGFLNKYVSVGYEARSLGKLIHSWRGHKRALGREVPSSGGVCSPSKQLE